MPQYTRGMLDAIPSDFDPRIDPVAAGRWEQMPAHCAPWLHEEVGRRMAARMAYIKLPTKDWANWSWRRGGQGFKPEQAKPLGARWAWGLRALLSPLGLSLPKPSAFPRPRAFKPPADLSQDLIWSNMQLHMDAAPKRTIKAWHSALKTNGFVMFSCLGPDTLIELRAAYARRDWSAPMHALTDMHDWGDRLLTHGFAQPVMDMERLVLTFESPQRALQELRELGRNLILDRGTCLQPTSGKAWRRELLNALSECRNVEGQIALTFELIYGHAIKPTPRIDLSSSASVSLAQMRELLRR